MINAKVYDKSFRRNYKLTVGLGVYTFKNREEFMEKFSNLDEEINKYLDDSFDLNMACFANSKYDPFRYVKLGAYEYRFVSQKKKREYLQNRSVIIQDHIKRSRSKPYIREIVSEFNYINTIIYYRDIKFLIFRTNLGNFAFTNVKILGDIEKTVARLMFRRLSKFYWRGSHNFKSVGIKMLFYFGLLKKSRKTCRDRVYYAVFMASYEFTTLFAFTYYSCDDVKPMSYEEAYDNVKSVENDLYPWRGIVVNVEAIADLLDGPMIEMY